MEAAAAAAMDFHTLSRRELQALCKRNGVRANMTNAAMAEALQGLTTVDGIDEIGTTLCLPTPGRSAMKSAAKMAQLAGEEQHGSPLPRGRRVSVKSPEAIRMEVEEGEDEMKRDLVKEIVRTPGVALRSTSRRARATPAPLPTPVPASSARATRRTVTRKTEVAPTPATLRRSQRTAGRKAAAPEEVEQPADDVSAEKRPTRSARSKMTMALDQEEEVAAAMPKVEEKVQQEELKVVGSDLKCDDPDEDEVSKLLEGDNKEEEPEDGEEADSSDATIGSAVASDKNCLDNKMEEEATKPQEGVVEEKDPVSVEKPASLATMEDSPILGVLSKAEASEPDIVKAQDASIEDDEGCAKWSPVMKRTDEINEEATQEDACTPPGETDHYPEEILPTAAEEDGLTEVKEGASLEDDEGCAEWSPVMKIADEISEEAIQEDVCTPTCETDNYPEEILPTAKEDGPTEVKEGADDEMLQADLADVETSEEDEDELPTELKGAVDEMQQAELADNETNEEDEEDRLAELKEETYSTDEDDESYSTEGRDEDEEIYSTEGSDEDEEIYSTEDSDEEAGETSDESDTTNAVQMLQGTVIAEEVNQDAYTEDDDLSEESDTADVVQMLQGTVIAGEADEDASTEDDDFSSDLPPEFDNLVFGDSDTENDTSAPVLEENQAVVASATKTAVKSVVDSAITAEQKEEVSDGADATEKATKELDDIVNSLDEFAIKEGEAMEEIQKLPQVVNFESMSLRKLKSTWKERLIASKDGKVVAEGKRLPLEEVDENASADC